MSTKAALGGHVLIWEDPAGAIPGGGQYFYALVIVGGFCDRRLARGFAHARNEAGKKARPV